MQETWVQSLGPEDPPREGNGNSNILAREIPWTKEPGGLWSIGLERVRHNVVAEQQNKQQQSV